MSRVLVIPDIHQHLVAAEAMFTAGEAERADRIVLLGDLFDEYDDTPADTVAAARWLLRQKERFGERLVVLIGNHDLPYLEACQVAGASRHLDYGYRPVNGCPGYTDAKAEALVREVGPDFVALWRLHHREDGVLYTHAGASAAQNNRLDADATELLANLHRAHPLFEIGFARGGGMEEAGLLWRDLSEFDDDAGCSQIFGHTPRKCARIIGKSACLDAHYRVAGIVEDGASLEIFAADSAPVEIQILDTKKARSFEMFNGRPRRKQFHPVMSAESVWRFKMTLAGNPR